ncbi:hypothetical protein L6164_032338 [Bauhinia variegata]|uniref:Uncharacterized protein n=1 Tax=Bauhinia variegata TaxID=167791 RepID=A0ACB9KNJ9_BAUVA|nr:hypothetical protein L6164_032338 [Bauhinia variegata]
MSASTNPSPSATEVASEDARQQIKLLTCKEDAYSGVIVEIDEPMDSTSFVLRLKASILQWKQQGKKGVWIKLPIELVNLAEPLVKERFWYHHAEPKYIMFVYWIPEGPNTIPANASHQIGVGAFVVNDKKEVLVVQEKSGLLRRKGAWKFPTGVVNQGEDICAAVVREVKEETGVASEFVEVLAFRQNHKAFFGKSDLFFLCMLRPVSSNIVIDETEIEAAQWMPFEEYSAQSSVQNSKLLKYMSNVCRAKIDGHYAGFAHVPTNSLSDQRKRYLYLNAGGLERSNSL